MCRVKGRHYAQKEGALVFSNYLLTSMSLHKADVTLQISAVLSIYSSPRRWTVVTVCACRVTLWVANKL